jgi:hypothetical protein
MRTAMIIALTTLMAVVTAGLTALHDDPDKPCRDVLREAHLQSPAGPACQATTERPVECASLSDTEYLTVAAEVVTG